MTICNGEISAFFFDDADEIAHGFEGVGEVCVGVDEDLSAGFGESFSD